MNELFEYALAESRELGLFAGQPEAAARTCVIAATYVSFCAPRTATERQYRIVTMFIVVFFWLDDSDPHALAALHSTGQLAVDALPPLARWRARVTELDTCHPELAAAWLDAMRGYFASVADELAVDLRTITLAEHLEVRRRSIFVDPYVGLWLALLDELPPAAHLETYTRARWLVRELILYANDLGALERDLATERVELNLVRTLAQQRGCSIGEAVGELVAEHNCMAAELRRLLATLAPHAPTLVDTLRQITNGNLASLRALVERYGNTERVAVLELV
jgi:hypothetical protein